MALVFDGSDDKVEHATANVLNSANTMSMLAWIYITGNGELSPRLLSFPEAGTTMRWFISSGGGAELQFQYDFTGGGSADGVWRTPLTSLAQNRWFCVAVTYDRSATTNDPLMWIWDTGSAKRLVSQTVTESTTPIGTSADPATGYCVGNVSGQTSSYQGRMAYLQFWNRILTEGELQTAALFPGRVTGDLRLFLPMLVDGVDWSGLNQPGTVTGATVGDNPPTSTLFAGNNGWAGAFTVAGGTTYNSSVSGAMTPSGALLKSTSKIVAGANTPAGALTKQTNKTLSGALSSIVGTLTKNTAKLFAGTLTTEGVLTQVRTFLVSVSGALTSAGALVRDTTKALAGTLTSSGTVNRVTSLSASGAITPTGGIIKSINKALSGALSSIVGALSTLLNSVAGALNFTETRVVFESPHKTEFESEKTTAFEGRKTVEFD